jgi:16S rRNA (cytidine1402-2'-O)-methyltransferase
MLEADVLLCEDTRSPLRLLGEGAELPPRLSCFVGNEAERVPLVLEYLERGERVALVSEAGLPLWSDPGYPLVRAALEAGHAVDVIPGPTAAALAVCHSGLPATEVRFLGFMPRDGRARTRVLEDLGRERATVVLHEAPNRVPALLCDLAASLADADTRRAAVARELTKLHQEVVRGTVRELENRLREPPRGEVTVVLEGCATPLPDAATEAARLAVDVMLDDGLRPREKAKRLAALTGLDARELYDRIAGKGREDTT